MSLAAEMVMTDTLAVRVARRWPEARGIEAFELVHPEGEALPAFRAGAHVDVHLPRALATLWPTDEERLDRHGKGPAGRIPLAAFKEQVLPAFKPEQRHCRKAAVFPVKPEKDRIFAGQPAEFTRHHQARHHAIAKLGRGISPDAQGAVIGRVQNLVVAHDAAAGLSGGDAASAAK